MIFSVDNYQSSWRVTLLVSASVWRGDSESITIVLPTWTVYMDKKPFPEPLDQSHSLECSLIPFYMTFDLSRSAEGALNCANYWCEDLGLWRVKWRKEEEAIYLDQLHHMLDFVFV